MRFSSSIEASTSMLNVEPSSVAIVSLILAGEAVEGERRRKFEHGPH